MLMCAAHLHTTVPKNIVVELHPNGICVVAGVDSAATWARSSDPPHPTTIRPTGLTCVCQCCSCPSATCDGTPQCDGLCKGLIAYAVCLSWSHTTNQDRQARGKARGSTTLAKPLRRPVSICRAWQQDACRASIVHHGTVGSVGGIDGVPLNAETVCSTALANPDRSSAWHEAVGPDPGGTDIGGGDTPAEEALPDKATSACNCTTPEYSQVLLSIMQSTSTFRGLVSVSTNRQVCFQTAGRMR
jgi:hypothetical protein